MTITDLNYHSNKLKRDVKLLSFKMVLSLS